MDLIHPFLPIKSSYVINLLETEENCSYSVKPSNSKIDPDRIKRYVIPIFVVD